VSVVVPPVTLSRSYGERSEQGYKKVVLPVVRLGGVWAGLLQDGHCHTRAMSVDRMHSMDEPLVDSVEVARGNLLVLRHDTVLGHDGGRHLREVVAHRGGVAIVPLTADHKVVLIRQYRHAVGEVLLEIPAGTLDRLENGDIEEPDGAARRELGEEIGQTAAKWLKFGVFYTTPGFSTEAMHLYLARELTPIEGYEGPEPDENLVIEEVPVDAALRLAETGEIRDGKTLVGLFWLGRWLAENDG